VNKEGRKPREQGREGNLVNKEGKEIW